MIDELELIRHVRPEVAPPGAETRIAARQALEHAIADHARRPRTPRHGLANVRRLAPALGILVVIAVAAVFLSVQGRKPGSTAPGAGLELIFQAEPTPQAHPVGATAMSRTVAIVRDRLDSVLPGARVSSTGDQLVVRIAGGTSATGSRVAALVRDREQLLFYDWEANALTPGGKSVAALLQRQDPTALQISQGSGAAAPGTAGAGSMSLYLAVQVAAKQPRSPSNTNSRLGLEYFMFGAPGSSACTTAARYYHVKPITGQHCYLAGPEDSVLDLVTTRPPGVGLSAHGVQLFAVRQGWTVLQAVSPNGYDHDLPWSDPTAQYYVLRDNVALFGNSISNPRQSTDQSRAPDVEFGFTGVGQRRFQTLTARLALRGDVVSGLGVTINQHFAVALDSQLITVPSIDFKAYPDGIPGDNGADITGGFTTKSARRLAAQLRAGALPVSLRLLEIRR